MLHDVGYESQCARNIACADAYYKQRQIPTGLARKKSETLFLALGLWLTKMDSKGKYAA